jgi:exopolyphosphatase/guanosine-5'-triphosphate,3'-diphosphate pyrophosphatase
VPSSGALPSASPRPGPYACIDVGSNTTRLLVAEQRDGRLQELCAQRSFTRLGQAASRREPIPRAKLEETAEVVALQADLARRLGALRTVAVATAAIREAPNGDDLVAVVEERAGLPLKILSPEEEARLAFVGATKTLGAPPAGTIAVVDVGGGSSEIAVGSMAAGMTWAESFRIGSGFLADAYLRSDPPAAAELEAARAHAAGVFEGLEVPPVDQAVGAGGSASSLRRLAGTELGPTAMERAISVLASAPRAEVARRFELDPERVRLLPAGVLILEAVSLCLGRQLMIGNGGLREGVILELVGG